MEDTFEILDWLWLVLPPLWLAGLAAVLRDWRQANPAGVEQARCGLPRQPLAPPPAAGWLRGFGGGFQRRRPAM
ncbi:hypothetical protein [Falsiroseomonas selenitidurans]|uniref:Uncharacterized protein n=1 Tax=Falsiroseomonas selenitidurans TaxID=2716335 RepID=A0ABX1E0D5_9PROT|nr:hypothetical protein [Falsiroseomonas selenitidurans]NKC30605.1 hypothetical protein [Falsiroseomonas selenitidurans]